MSNVVNKLWNMFNMNQTGEDEGYQEGYIEDPEDEFEVPASSDHIVIK